jgi:hypothetical protein
MRRHGRRGDFAGRPLHPRGEHKGHTKTKHTNITHTPRTLTFYGIPASRKTRAALLAALANQMRLAPGVGYRKRTATQPSTASTAAGILFHLPESHPVREVAPGCGNKSEAPHTIMDGFTYAANFFFVLSTGLTWDDERGLVRYARNNGNRNRNAAQARAHEHRRDLHAYARTLPSTPPNRVHARMLVTQEQKK